MYWKIEPTSETAAVINSGTIKTPEDAMEYFARCMDSDMSAYFKATEISGEEFEELKGYEM